MTDLTFDLLNPIELNLDELQESILSESSLEYYSFGRPYRYYHNIDHITHVIDSSTLIASAETPYCYDVSLLLAAQWHDAVYIPGAGEAVNEFASAAALQHTWTRFGITADPRILERAKLMIGNTSIATHLRSENLVGNRSLQILLDADLSSLAADYDDFVDNQAAIIMENNGNPEDKDSRAKCGAFLTMLANARPYIFHTETGRHWFEAKAHNNIQKYVKENS